jgi:SMODS and SLOG-associating 2TM effector domain family 4
MGKKPPATTEELLQDWYRRARENQFAHYEALKPLASANYKLGIPVAILSALVGTSIFATLQHETAIGFRIGVGFVSVLAAVLASIQTFLRFTERAEKHRAAAARYGALRRELEAVISKGGPFEDKVVQGLREKLDAISSESLEIPESIWKKTESLLENRP